MKSWLLFRDQRPRVIGRAALHLDTLSLCRLSLDAKSLIYTDLRRRRFMETRAPSQALNGARRRSRSTHSEAQEIRRRPF
jgi:hypothetical protein